MIDAISRRLGGRRGWEYKVLAVSERKSEGAFGAGGLEDALNGQGAVGWELVQVVNDRAVFKWRDPDSYRGHHDFQGMRLRA